MKILINRINGLITTVAFIALCLPATVTAGEASAATENPDVETPGEAEQLNTKTYWVGNTWAGGDYGWVQNEAEDIFVYGNRIFCNSHWDEASAHGASYDTSSGNIAVQRLPHLKGWSRIGGPAVTADADYCYLSVARGWANGTEAEGCDSQSGADIYDSDSCSEGKGVALHNTGDWLCFADRNLKSTAMKYFHVTAASDSGGVIEVRLDSVRGTLIASCDVPDTGGGQWYEHAKCLTEGAFSGVHDVYLVHAGGAVNLDSWVMRNHSSRPPTEYFGGIRRYEHNGNTAY
jgi:hypothetical protein